MSAEFPVYGQGQLRELFLSVVRDGLRGTTNPDTNQEWTEEEIQLATSPGTSEFARATAVDLILFAIQSRAPWLADQVVAGRASPEWLRTMHAPTVGAGDPLPATGGGGPVSAPVTGTTTFLGSTDIPDPTAHLLVDSGGRRYQVLYTVAFAGAGVAPIQVKAIDGGLATNLAVGTQLRWYRAPAGVSSVTPPTVTERFRGGRPIESSAEYADRILEEKRYRRGAGTSPDWRSWARRIDSSIQEVFVYPCGLNAGSVVLVPTQRRDAGDLSPTARIPTAGLLAIITARMVPPGAADVPASPFVLVVGPQYLATTMTANLRMPSGKGRGWLDSAPWPRSAAGDAVTVTNVTSQTLFEITLPGGADDPEPGQVPRLAVWDYATSSFELLDVASWSTSVAGVYQITLTNAPSTTIAVGAVVSPAMGCASEVASGVRAYFDALGTGQLVADTDLRSGRSTRFPDTSTRWPSVPGNEVADYIRGKAIGLISSGSGRMIGATTTDPPEFAVDGPQLRVISKFGAYPQE